jgi:hypothetical protein
MNTLSISDYEDCAQAVYHHYRTSETPGLRRVTEYSAVLAIARYADSSGLLPDLDVDYLADLSRMTPRTFRQCLGVLFDIGWLIERIEGGRMRVRIDPMWLKNLPPKLGEMPPEQ